MYFSIFLFKINAFNWVHRKDISSVNIKAVNCIKNVNNKLIGYNTDSYGFEKMIKNIGISLDEHTFLVLGNGGASHTVVSYLLNHTKNEISIWGRNTNKVESHTREFNSSQITPYNPKINKPTIIINCLSLNIKSSMLKFCI